MSRGRIFTKAQVLLLLVAMAPAAAQDEESEKQQVLKDWEQNYQVEVRVYSMSDLSPSSAQTLISQFLRAYVLIAEGNEATIRTFELEDQTASQFGAIYPIVRERAVADEKANAVIVTAIPKTHEKIEKLLAEMEAMLGEKEETAIPERYRLQVVLLRGVQESVEARRRESSNSPSSQRNLDTIVDGMTVEDQSLVDFVGRLASLAQTEIRVATWTAPMRVALKYDDDTTVQKILQDVAIQYDLEIVYETDGVTLKPHERSFPVTKTPDKAEKNGLDEVAESLSVADRSLIEFASLLAELSESSINVVPEIQRTKISFNSPKPRKIRDILEDISAVYGFRIEYRPDMTIIHPERRFGNFEPEKPDSVSLKEYGISEEDLDVIGFQSAEELGRGVVDLAGAKGEEGEAFLSLTGAYAFEFEYMDLREPYLIAKGRLVEKDEERTLLENTLYLEPEQPSLLGLTNLREALILMVKRLGS